MTTIGTRLFSLLSAALAAPLLLAACGGEPAETRPAPDQRTAEFNDADVMFAQMMIVHHEQAIEMSRLADDRAEGDDVRRLATEIEDAQGPEIDQLTEMLESWGEEPVDGRDDLGHDMEGMLTDQQMAGLEGSEGDAFDTTFLELMVEHHEGAVEMARTELDKGANPEARKLAEDVVDVQEAEIERMNDMLAERR